MLVIRYIYLFCAFAVIWSCHSPVGPGLEDGDYTLQFHAQGYQIPVHLKIDDGAWKIINANDTLVLRSELMSDDSLVFKTPLFQSYLHVYLGKGDQINGQWHDLSRTTPYHVDFTITKKTEHLTSSDITTTENYDVFFSPHTADSTHAIGAFHVKNGDVQGTFMTESGDYRFLSGRWLKDSMFVSCFDGAHLFYFSARIQENQLTQGVFVSGNHWKENWEGVRNASASLQDPDAITTLRDTLKPFEFNVRSLDGKEVHFDSTTFKNHVTIVQLFGSWCPNCTDESKLFLELYGQYASAGLQIIPIAFERLDDVVMAKKVIGAQFQEIGITYPAYFGGKSSKDHAATVFPMLSSVSSYPTSIFLDKSGKVRKIHTGFYGPGTGNAYILHRDRIREFVELLLHENESH